MSTEVLILREQLATAQEEIKQYKDTIISQANELAVLRNHRCTGCKSKTGLGSSLRRPRSNSPSEPDIATRNVKRRLNPSVGADLTRKSFQPHLPSSELHAATAFSAPQSCPPVSVSQITSKPPHPARTLATILSDNPNPTLENKFFVLPIVPDIKRALPNVTFVDTFKHKTTVHSVKFSPNGKYLAVGLAGGIYGDEQGRVLVYNLETRLKSYALAEHSAKEKSGIRSMAFSPDGEHLAVGYYQAHISIWNVAKKRVRNRFRGHERLITSLDFSPNGHLVVSASSDKTIRIWSMRDGSSRILARNALSFRSARFSPNGQYIAAGNEDHIFRVWNTRTGQLMLKWIGHQSAVECVTFTPDGKGLVSGSYDKKLKYWDISSLIPARVAQSGPLGTGADSEGVVEFVGHTEAVTSVDRSPDGKWILSGSIDHSVRIWDAGDSGRHCKLEGHRGLIWSVSFSPIGDYLAAGGWEGEVSLWKCIK